MSRLPLPDLENLTVEQKVIADSVASGPRGEVRGPIRLWLHSPELADHAQKLGTFLRWGTVLSQRISELVILTTARRYTCHYVWFNHIGLAATAGLSEQAIAAIKVHGDPRPFLASDEAVAYALALAILSDESTPDDLIRDARAIFGDRGVVELSSIIGHYHTGAILLSLSDIRLPNGSRECLPAVAPK